MVLTRKSIVLLGDIFMNFKFNQCNNVLKITLLSIFCALSVSVSFLESLIPISPVLPPGTKLGFSNIITMFVCATFGIHFSIIIIIVKSLFVAFSRGFIAFMLSLLAGLLSTFITGILIRYFSNSISNIFIGIIGASVHNFTQILVASFFVGNIIFYYLPFLLLVSLFTGSLTGIVFNIILPILYKQYSLFKH